MKKLFVMVAMLLFVGTAFSLTSCRNQKKDNKVENAMDNAKDAVDTAAQNTKDAVKKGSDKLKDETHQND